jgi:hypothetical protein
MEESALCSGLSSIRSREELKSLIAGMMTRHFSKTLCEHVLLQSSLTLKDWSWMSSGILISRLLSHLPPPPMLLSWSPQLQWVLLPPPADLSRKRLTQKALFAHGEWRFLLGGECQPLKMIKFQDRACGLTWVVAGRSGDWSSSSSLLFPFPHFDS